MMKTYLLSLLFLLGSFAFVGAQSCLPNTNSLDFNGEVHIFNLSGQLQQSLSLGNKTETDIDISHLSPGMYFLKLNKAGESLVRKLMVW